MKKFAALVAASAMLSTAAFAGGPVVIESEPVPQIAGPSSSLSGGAVIAGLAGLALVAALASSNGDDNTTTTTN